jgi:hypothetical protein
MKEHYFLLDNVENWPYGSLHVKRGGHENHPIPVDHFLSHFAEFSYANFYNTLKSDILNPKATKFILNFIHMPQTVEFAISSRAKSLLQKDPKTFLVLLSPLEYQITPLELSKFCTKNKLPLNKIIVLCSATEFHKQTINGIKYICINFWESITRHHHQLLPETYVINRDDRLKQIQNATKKFICLNRNVKPHRIWFMYSMVKAEILDQGHVSYHLPKIRDDDYNMLCQGDFVLKRIPKHLHKDFKKTNKTQMWPRMLDKLDDEARIQYHTGPTPYYQDSLLSFVTESESSKNFLTEKTYKAIVNMHPFFIIGNPDQHTLLRARGYHTFESLFGVSSVMNFDQAMKMLEKIKALDINVLKTTLEKNYLDKLIHNYNNFFTRRISWQTIVQEIFDATERR